MNSPHPTHDPDAMRVILGLFGKTSEQIGAALGLEASGVRRWRQRSRISAPAIPRIAGHLGASPIALRHMLRHGMPHRRQVAA